ncbi:MAG: hypothetical protein ACAH65_04520 [Chloroflexota bacterium]
MDRPDSKAELLDDRSTSLAPRGSRAFGGLFETRWPIAGIALAGWLVVALIALDSPASPASAVPSAPPSAPAAAALSTPTAAPSPTAAPLPTIPESPCVNDRVQFSPARDPEVPNSYRPAGLPSGGVAAFVVEEGTTRASIMVAGAPLQGEMTARRVATYGRNDLANQLYVSLVGWSASGDVLLVRADQYRPDEGLPEWMSARGIGCSNLFLVHADGSEVTYLTGEGSDELMYDAALAPRSGKVAYSTDGAVRLIPPELDGTESSCETAWSLRWSPDEQRLLALCNGLALMVIDTVGGGWVQATPPDRLYPQGVRWSADGSSITVVAMAPDAGEGDPLAILDFVPETATFTRRADISLAPSFYFQDISPDGRWIVIQDVNDPTTVAIVDLTSGAMSNLFIPEATGEYGPTAFAWRSDGETALLGLNSVLYSVDLPTGTLAPVGWLPATQFSWHDFAP